MKQITANSLYNYKFVQILGTIIAKTLGFQRSESTDAFSYIQYTSSKREIPSTIVNLFGTEGWLCLLLILAQNLDAVIIDRNC